jgi:FtsP/CotA-like multicopper oxidase with cupredoxin domain
MRPQLSRFSLARLGALVAPAAASALLIASATGMPARAATTNSGMVCTTGPSFTLTAQSGTVPMPDGNTIYMWSYSPGSGAFQLPGPTLCVNQGDTVTVVLNNTLPEDVSIVFLGQDGVTANGVDAQPQFTSNELTSLVQPAAKSGGTITYRFTANNPGTYLYESGTDPAKQVQMGLYGSLVVRSSKGANYAYNRVDSQFDPTTEYLMLFSEVDPMLHQAVETGGAYDIMTYHPRYWLINGRSFPDTIADNFAAWLPDQPYGALVHIQPNIGTSQPALVRYLNAGALNHPFHPHGNHGRVVGRDGNPLESDASARDLSYEKFLVMLGAGQTWDVTYDWRDIEKFSPTNPIPVALPQQQNLTYKDSATWFSGSPYLGLKGSLPVGTTSYNQCGEYYQVWHSHALNEAANWDTGFGGMFTLERIDPPGGCK